MYVKDRMTKNLIVSSANSTISEVLDVMKEHGFHRIPIADENNKLLGLITASVIAQNTPNNSSSLSIYETNYMLNNIRAKDIMIKDVKTIGPDDLLEEAAYQMRKSDIGCLPVVEKGKMIGIITHNDIFDSFIDLLGYLQDGTRYVINIQEDKPGIMHDIAKYFAELHISISNLAVDKSDRGIDVVVIATGKGSDKAKDILIKNGYNVTNVIKLKNNKLR